LIGIQGIPTQPEDEIVAFQCGYPAIRVPGISGRTENSGTLGMVLCRRRQGWPRRR
jgi:hypothetical protein